MGQPFFKGLATGGNVSAAMAASGEKATYESFMTFTNQMVLLGRNTFHVLMIRSWNERIDYLVKANNYLDCLALGMDFYTDQGKALVGLKGPKEKRKTVIAQKNAECTSKIFRRLHEEKFSSRRQYGSFERLFCYRGATLCSYMYCFEKQRHSL